MTDGGARVFAGLDEAGYGPMLGPLTIGVAALRAPAPVDWDLLRGAVSRSPRDDGGRLVVADSKQVFTRNPRGERRLECTALAFHRASGRPGTTGAEFIAGAPAGIGPGAEVLARHPWYGELPETLPHRTPAGVIDELGGGLARALDATGAAVLEAFALPVPAGQLNDSFAATSNKGATLWSFNSRAILYLFETHGAEGLDLVVDRLGGRSRYGRQLSSLIPFSTVDVVSESRDVSEYRVRDASNRRMRIRFAQKGDDRFLPVALASCLAKYARELAMGAFNAYFAARCPGLRPTAGYVTDARRWLAEVDADAVSELQKRDVLVRAR